MDVNSINNNLNSLNNNLSSQHISSSNKSENVSTNDKSLSLSIKEYNKKRDELSASLQSFNEGIGISITANSTLQKQKQYLTNIENKLTSVKLDLENLQDKNQIKNELNQDLQRFREDAFNTTYKRENLLYVDEYDQNNTINISTKEAYFSIDKPNTPDIAAGISNEITKNDFNNPTSLVNTIEAVQEGRKEIENIQLQFKDLRDNLQTSAKESIQTQKELSNQNRVTKQFDFPKEVTDFSKSNINANAGYLAASQANIVQEQSVKLVGVK